MTISLLSGACMAADELLSVELAFEAPGQRMAQVTVEWASGSVTGQVRTRVPGCEQPWHADCWARRPLQASLSLAQREGLLQLLAPVPLAHSPRHAAPGATHYSMALVRRQSVSYGMALPGDGAAASAIEQALTLAGAAP
ncbi:hypothetical protein ACWA7J_21030 [Leptothrix sp. BB-4]